MIIKQIMEVYELVDTATASGNDLKKYLESYGAKNSEFYRVLY